MGPSLTIVQARFDQIVALRLLAGMAVGICVGCSQQESTLPPDAKPDWAQFSVFFSRALDAIVEDDHLTIYVPESIALVDSVYADETNDLPMEVRCDSVGDREVLSFYMFFRPDNPAVNSMEDKRFQLLHTQDRLAEPIRIWIVRRGSDATKPAGMQHFFIRSASIKRHGTQ